jgi:hypothetical protein
LPSRRHPSQRPALTIGPTHQPQSRPTHPICPINRRGPTATMLRRNNKKRNLRKLHQLLATNMAGPCLNKGMMAIIGNGY